MNGNIWTLYLNLNVRSICWDISPGFLPDVYMFGNTHSCWFFFRAFLTYCLWTLASASAKRQLWLFMCAVCSLDFASDVPSPAGYYTDHPNWHKCKAVIPGNAAQTTTSDQPNCQICKRKVQRVYTLPRFPGRYNNWFWSFRLWFREDDNTVWVVWGWEDSRTLDVQFWCKS